MNELEVISNKLPQIIEGLEKADYLNRDEVNKLISTVKDSEKSQGLLIMLLWRTGIRISEAIAIKKKDIDFMNKTMKVRWLKKRKAMDRYIPLENDLAYSLSLYCGNMTGEDRLFPYTRVRAWQIVQKLWKRSGLQKKISPHTFRHSFSVHFLKQTKNLPALQKLLGHSQITTTMVYLNIVQSDLKEELDKVEW